MKNKYVLLLFLYFCGECVCRRPPIFIRPPSSSNTGSGESLLAVAFIMLPNIGGWISYGIAHFMARKPKVEHWQYRLKMPRLYPPSWFILCVWTLLYLAIGYVSYMVYEDCGGFTNEAILPFTLYGIQLLVNWSWSLVFIGFRSTKVGLIHFVILDIAAVACTSSFFYINMYTMCAMGPLLAFLGFMTAMMYMNWKINHKTEHETNEEPIDNSPQHFANKYSEHGIISQPNMFYSN